jgi:hypothetical protein
MNRFTSVQCFRKNELSRYLLRFEKDYYHDTELEVELTLKRWYKSSLDGDKLLSEKITNVQYPVRNLFGQIVGYFSICE